jgi:hypothetical protein
MQSYEDFLKSKRIIVEPSGFDVDKSAINPKLFPFQADCTTWAVKRGRAALFLMTGLGKCHGINTPVIMHDGSVKMVQDVQIGDKLMGPDSTPRTVLNTTTGYGKMFRINPIKGDSFTCNEDHILSLRCTSKYNKTYKKDELINVSLCDYLNKTKAFKHLMKLWRAPVNFDHVTITLDPYIAGCWLGDGGYNRPLVTKTRRETEIVEYFHKFAKSFGNSRHRLQ